MLHVEHGSFTPVVMCHRMYGLVKNVEDLLEADRVNCRETKAAMTHC